MLLKTFIEKYMNVEDVDYISYDERLKFFELWVGNTKFEIIDDEYKMSSSHGSKFINIGIIARNLANSILISKGCNLFLVSGIGSPNILNVYIKDISRIKFTIYVDNKSIEVDDRLTNVDAILTAIKDKFIR
jgi:hypothetical protein